MSIEENKNKIIILGLAESGKSTIVKSFTEGHKSSQEGTYSATINYERKAHSFLGKELTIFDLGGQQSFIDRFTGSLAEFIFSEVKAFIFVIDVSKFEEISRSKYYLDLALKNLTKYSPNAHRYIFIHKVDLVQQTYINEIENRFVEFLLDGVSTGFKIYCTSVFRDTLYTALGDVFSNISDVEKSIDPLIKDFVSSNSNIAFGGLLTKNGTQLVASNLFPQNQSIAYSSAIIVTEEYIQHIFKTSDKKISLVHIELDNISTFIKYLNTDLILVVGFNKTQDYNYQTLFSKISVLVSMLESTI